MVKISAEQILAAVEEDSNLGFCTACGDEAYNVEPDARGYVCESCGQPNVSGAEELMFSLPLDAAGGFAD